MHRTASSITKNYSAENSNNVLRNPDIRTHVCVFVYVFKKKKKGTTKKSTGCKVTEHSRVLIEEVNPK